MLKISNVITMPFALNDIKESFLYTLFRPSTPKEYYKMTFIEHNYTFAEYFDMFYDILYENACTYIEILGTQKGTPDYELEKHFIVEPKFMTEQQMCTIISRQIATHNKFINKNIKFSYHTNIDIVPTTTILRGFDENNNVIGILFMKSIEPIHGVEIRLIDFKYS